MTMPLAADMIIFIQNKEDPAKTTSEVKEERYIWCHEIIIIMRKYVRMDRHDFHINLEEIDPIISKNRVLINVKNTNRSRNQYPGHDAVWNRLKI